MRDFPTTAEWLRAQADAQDFRTHVDHVFARNPGEDDANVSTSTDGKRFFAVPRGAWAVVFHFKRGA